MVRRADGLTQSLEGKTIVVLDTETTGLRKEEDRIIEFAAKRYLVEGGKLKETASISFIIDDPNVTEVPEFITNLTGITIDDVDAGVSMHAANGMIHDFISGAIVVAHHASFDLGFLYQQYGVDPSKFLCTRSFARLIHPEESASLSVVAERLGVPQDTAHRAMADVNTTAAVLEKLIEISSDFVPVNVLVASPERALTYVPGSTRAIVDPYGSELVRNY